MRFIVDENSGPFLAAWLRDQGHDVFSVFEEARGLSDSGVLAKANHENRILITLDKDFGERIFREGQTHKGIILLRLSDERSASKINAINRVLKMYSNRLVGSFIVVTETKIRISS